MIESGTVEKHVVCEKRRKRVENADVLQDSETRGERGASVDDSCAKLERQVSHADAVGAILGVWDAAADAVTVVTHQCLVILCGAAPSGQHEKLPRGVSPDVSCAAFLSKSRCNAGRCLFRIKGVPPPPDQCCAVVRFPRSFACTCPTFVWFDLVLWIGGVTPVSIGTFSFLLLSNCFVWEGIWAGKTAVRGRSTNWRFLSTKLRSFREGRKLRKYWTETANSWTSLVHYFCAADLPLRG